MDPQFHAREPDCREDEASKDDHRGANRRSQKEEERDERRGDADKRRVGSMAGGERSPVRADQPEVLGWSWAADGELDEVHHPVLT
jgi:hypothetical protein